MMGPMETTQEYVSTTRFDKSILNASNAGRVPVHRRMPMTSKCLRVMLNNIPGGLKLQSWRGRSKMAPQKWHRRRSLQAVAEEKRSLGIEDGSLRRSKVLGAAAQVAYATL